MATQQRNAAPRLVTYDGLRVANQDKPSGNNWGDHWMLDGLRCNTVSTADLWEDPFHVVPGNPLSSVRVGA